MPPQQSQNSRRALIDLKSQIAGKLGPERSQRYFCYLNRLLGQKLSKSEFDKLCFLTLGRENIHLHNQFIRLILKNACQVKVPPPVIHDKEFLKPGKAVGKKSPSTDDWIHPSPATASTPSVWSNGEILSPSPCKSRSTNHRIKDHPSPVVANGKADAITHRLQTATGEVIFAGNGDFVSCDLKNPLQHQQRGLAELPTKKQRVEKPLPRDRVSVHNKGPIEVAVEDDKELVQTENAQFSRGPICAPLGIPFCPVRTSSANRLAPLSKSANGDDFAHNCHSGELCHTEALSKRMERIAEAQDLGGVTMECANILNNGLDAYLKQLIKSCVDLVRARSGHETIKKPLIKQQSQGKIINGIWQGNHMYMQSNVGSFGGTQEPKNHHQVSLLDFRVAMELNPQQLGEHWSLLLEKVCTHSFEE